MAWTQCWFNTKRMVVTTDPEAGFRYETANGYTRSFFFRRGDTDDVFKLSIASMLTDGDRVLSTSVISHGLQVTDGCYFGIDLDEDCSFGIMIASGDDEEMTLGFCGDNADPFDPRYNQRLIDFVEDMEQCNARDKTLAFLRGHAVIPGSTAIN